MRSQKELLISVVPSAFIILNSSVKNFTSYLVTLVSFYCVVDIIFAKSFIEMFEAIGDVIFFQRRFKFAFAGCTKALLLQDPIVPLGEIKTI